MKYYENKSILDIDGEIWKDIPEYEGLYQVSSFGRIKSLCRESVDKTRKRDKLGDKILSQASDKDGYKIVCLSNNGNRKNKKVHRLIGICFHDNPLGKPIINHKRGIKDDNTVDGIEWSTERENTVHAFDNGLRNGMVGERNGMYGKKGILSPTSKPVLNTQTGIFYDTLTDAANSIGLKPSTLSEKLNGKCRNSTSLIWA